MQSLGATDLFLTRGKSPAFRINGRITNTEGQSLTSSNLETLARAVIPDQFFNQFEEDLELSFCITRSGVGRFRISMFRQRGDIAMVVRSIPAAIPSMESLGIPKILRNIVMQRRGLILLVGPTGTGKSTTLASLLDYRNHNDAAHIITLEDPIEYVIEHRQSVVNQREIGLDTKSYHQALTSALRQSPDVMAIGEIRTREAMEHAILFADIGHLCIATLHANNASQAFERIVNMFPENKREQILLSLSLHIRAVVSQQLVPNTNGQLTGCFELMTATPRVSELIRQADFEGLADAMEKGASSGMQTMDQCLYSLYENGDISPETALEYANSYRNMRLKMRLASSTPSVVS
jgi:twitching motility protein PilU